MLVLQYAKKAINKGMDTNIEAGIAIEADYFGRCFATEDQESGMQAFLKKEK